MEREERNKRLLNLIFFGVIESRNEEPKQRKSDDIASLNAILHELGIDDGVFSQPTRLGSVNNNNNRPLRVQVSKLEIKQNIQANAWKLKNTRFRKIGIGNDMTWKERQERNLLRTQMKERTENGEQNLTIRGNKIVTIKNKNRFESAGNLNETRLSQEE